LCAAATTAPYTLSLHDALPICGGVTAWRVLRVRKFSASEAAVRRRVAARAASAAACGARRAPARRRSRPVMDGIRPVAEPEARRSEEHTSELQSRENLVCRLLL